MKKIKCIIVDDHQLVRDGIKALLAESQSVEVIAEATGGSELMSLLKTFEPQIILMDLSMPGIPGFDLIKMVKKNYPAIHILVLSMFMGEDYVFHALKAGAQGYIHKNTTRKELLQAICTVSSGSEYFSDEVSAIILKSYIRKVKNDVAENEDKSKELSSREFEILRLFAEGHSNQDIASKLFISIRTVESHKNHIMQKLELKSTVDLVKFAIRNGIIEL